MSKYIANAFQIPNAVVDDLMSRLSPNAFKCYVLIVRKTTGWGKSSDKISISQFQAIAGIKKRDTVISALAELEKLNLILPVKKAGLVNEFRLNKLPEITPKPVPKMVTTTSPENGDGSKNGTSPENGDGTSPENGDGPKNGTSPENKNGTSPDNRVRVVPKMVTTTSPENGDTQNPLTKPTRQNTPLPPQNADDENADCANALVAADATTGGGCDEFEKPIKQAGKPEDKKTKTKTAAPVAEIVKAYNAILGEVMPKAVELTDYRKREITARWKQLLGSLNPRGKIRYSGVEDGLHYWRGLFAKALENPHWCGDNDRNWRADLDWFMKPRNFTKLVEFIPQRTKR